MFAIASYVISVVFAVAFQVMLFRTGHLVRREYDTDAGIGFEILGIAAVWPVMLVALGSVWCLERLGRFTHE